MLLLFFEINNYLLQTVRDLSLMSLDGIFQNLYLSIDILSPFRINSLQPILQKANFLSQLTIFLPFRQLLIHRVKSLLIRTIELLKCPRILYHLGLNGGEIVFEQYHIVE